MSEIKMTAFEKYVAEFLARIAGNRAYCEHLYREHTIRLLAHKYAYYVNSEHFVCDLAYDGEEEDWRVMGTALGVLTPEDISPCIDFDYKHPLANEGIALANRLKPRKY